MNRKLLMIMLGCCGAMLILLKGGFLFMLLALMPSVMAYIGDTDPRKNSFKVVFSGNISAALPTLMPMVKTAFGSHKFDVMTAISDPMVWLFIYLGAGAGWALIYLCKFISRVVVKMSFEYHIKSLENVQQMLVEEWGQEITLGAQEPEEEI